MNMCEGPILINMLKFTIPLMLSSILQLLFNAADVVVVGKFAGDNSLGAVGCTGSLINLLTNLFVGLSVGANVMAARHYGAKQEDELTKSVHTSMVIAVIGGALLTLVGVLFAEPILRLMDTPELQLPLAATYLRIYFCGMIASMVYNFGSAILRAIGDTKRPMYYLTLAGVVNVILNMIFVIVLKMDVAGVAIATVTSQCISAVLVVRCMIKEKGPIGLDLKKLKVDKKELGYIVRIGLPAGLQGCIFSLSNVVIQSSINGFGETVVSGSSACSNLEGFVYVSMNAFHHATLSFMSQNYGAGRFDRMKKIMLCGLGCVCVTGLVLGNLEVFLGETLLGIYTDSPAVVAAGMIRMRYVCTIYCFCGMMDVMVGVMRGIGYSIMPMIVSLCGACGLRLIWIATVFQIAEYHVIDTVYVSYPMSWILTFLTHIGCYLIVRKKVFGRAAAEKC
ncbi:MAG: MATE family efflux transporter [Lachnospiraceae bacterium]|nr:MATE family efflux transporter [Lachnospiraceae bacterium]